MDASRTFWNLQLKFQLEDGQTENIYVFEDYFNCKLNKFCCVKQAQAEGSMNVSTSSLSPALERASSLYLLWICRHEVIRGLLPSAPPYRHELQQQKKYIY